MRQYQQTLQLMLSTEKELFDSFRSIHDAYVLDPESWKDKYNEVGQVVVDTIQRYERKLCSTTESGQYSKFSSNLSQKFWDEIRKMFPKIDFVGVT